MELELRSVCQTSHEDGGSAERVGCTRVDLINWTLYNLCFEESKAVHIAPFCCCPPEFPDDVNPVTREKGGPRGPEPTRYGDWERKGRCVDF